MTLQGVQIIFTLKIMIPSQLDKLHTPDRLKELYKTCEPFCTVTNVDIVGGTVYFKLKINNLDTIYSSMCFNECKLFGNGMGN